MSSYECPRCRKAIIEGEGGEYVTGCEHFPLPGQEKKKKKGVVDYFIRRKRRGTEAE